MFSLVGHDLRDVTVLDAFGGSGLLGLEAWSRGATVTVVEQHPKAAAAIRANVAHLGADVAVVQSDVRRWAETQSRGFEMVLVDPPYAEPTAPIVEALQALVEGVLVLELAAEGEAPSPSGLVLDRRREYGGTSLCLFRRRHA